MAINWIPIEQAPKDRYVIVYAPSRHGLPELVSLCKYHPDVGFCIDELRFVTHYIELPELPIT